MNNKLIDISETKHGFVIEHIAPRSDSLLVRPYSTLFKNPLSTYQAFNINLSNLRSGFDLTEQIIGYILPYIQQIINQEYSDVSTVVSILTSFDSNTITQDFSSLPIIVQNSIAIPELTADYSFETYLAARDSTTTPEPIIESSPSTQDILYTLTSELSDINLNIIN